MDNDPICASPSCWWHNSPCYLDDYVHFLMVQPGSKPRFMIRGFYILILHAQYEHQYVYEHVPMVQKRIKPISSSFGWFWTISQMGTPKMMQILARVEWPGALHTQIRLVVWQTLVPDHLFGSWSEQKKWSKEDQRSLAAQTTLKYHFCLVFDWKHLQPFSV